DVAQPVPDQPADIEFIVDDAGAALHVAADGGVAPRLAVRAGHAFLVQPARNAARADASGKLVEDASYDIGLGRVDLAVAPDRVAARIELFDDPVAIAKPAARLAFLDTSTDAAVGLGSKVFEEQRVHRPLEADVQLADLALGQRDDRHAGELQMLEQCRHIGLVAADPVQRLGQYHVELSCLRVLQQHLNAGPQDHAGPGNPRILVGANDLPLLALRLLPANPELVFNRRLALVVGGIAGIKGDACHGIASFRQPCRSGSAGSALRPKCPGGCATAGSSRWTVPACGSGHRPPDCAGRSSAPGPCGSVPAAPCGTGSPRSGRADPSDSSSLHKPRSASPARRAGRHPACRSSRPTAVPLRQAPHRNPPRCGWASAQSPCLTSVTSILSYALWVPIHLIQ